MSPFPVISRLLGFFSPYADSFERRVDRFLRRMGGHSRKELLTLVQEDLVKLTVFLEYRFMGYKNLRRANRKKLYENEVLIRDDFLKFFEGHGAVLRNRLAAMDLPFPLRREERMVYLLGIMTYLQPGARLQYEEAATFQKLLRDPANKRFAGDCNQITTLYIYLYSLRFSVSDLQIKLLPGHICLHFRGVDVETTSGTIARYPDYIHLSPVEEIVAANLLDIPDPREKRFEISPANVLKSAQLAYRFSAHRLTVERNLTTAYRNMAVYYARQRNFAKASDFADRSGDTRLQRLIIRMEGFERLKAKRYRQARERFQRIGDAEGERACAQNELADLLRQTRGLKTADGFRRHRQTLRRMKELAFKLEQRELVRFIDDVLLKTT